MTFYVSFALVVDVLSARSNRVPASATAVGDPRFATKNSTSVLSG